VAGVGAAVAAEAMIFRRNVCVQGTEEDSSDEATPSTTVSECSERPEQEGPEPSVAEDATAAHPLNADSSSSSCSCSSGHGAQSSRSGGHEARARGGRTHAESAKEVKARMPENITGDKDTDIDNVGAVGDDAEPSQRKAMDDHAPQQLGPGLYPSDEDFLYEEDLDEVERLLNVDSGCLDPSNIDVLRPPLESTSDTDDATPSIGLVSTPRETLFVLDWDDTILPSSWIQRQGLRLDEGSELADWQQELLSEVAMAAAGLLRMTKERGTVVLVTNAERGWIELSCRKFMPELMPCIEGVRIVSARTSYEGPFCVGPLDWKVRAFEAEVARIWRVADSRRTKNIHSIGDGVHEREALLLATQGLVNCLSKSLKFVERPDIGQLLRQHELIAEHLGRIVQHDGDLDVCISCP